MFENQQPPIFGQTDSLESSIETTKTKKTMDGTTKLIITISTAVVCVFAIVFGLFIGYSSYRENKISRAKELHEANIEALMELSICSKFTDSEQSRLESARNTGPERLKVVLAQIHEERREFWLQKVKLSSEAISDINNRANNAANLGLYSYVFNALNEQRTEVDKVLKQSANEAGAFSKAVDRINNWKPMTWDQYSKLQKKKPIDKDLDKKLNNLI